MSGGVQRATLPLAPEGGNRMTEESGRTANLSPWWAIAAILLALVFIGAALFWGYGIVTYIPPVLTLISASAFLFMLARPHGGRAYQISVIALAASWSLLVAPMTFMAIVGRDDPSWGGYSLIAAIGASALAIVAAQAFTKRKKSDNR